MTTRTPFSLALLLGLGALAPACAPDPADDDDDDEPCPDCDQDDDEELVPADDPGTCGDRDLDEATQVVHQLAALGYGDFDDEAFWGDDGTMSVVTDAETWAATVETWGADGGLHPDFALDVVFVVPWVMDGCNVAPTYTAWRWADALRLAVTLDHSDCDLGMPNLDYVVVPREGIDDIDLCP